MSTSKQHRLQYKRQPLCLKIILFVAAICIFTVKLQLLVSEASSSSASLELRSNTTDDKNSIKEGFHWRPSVEWIEQCVQSVQHNKSIVKPFNPGLYSGYVLGDCIKLCRGCYKGIETPELEMDSSLIMPTFATQYGGKQSKCPHGRNNLTHIAHVFFQSKQHYLKKFPSKSPGYATCFQEPDEDAVVIHLRLGDVIEKAKNVSVVDMLYRGASPAHHKNFRNSIKPISEYLDNLQTNNSTKVSIRGGSHKPKFYRKSRVYGHCLKTAIEYAGYDLIQYEIDSGNPDYDFYYMSHAKTYISTVGGYSRLIGKMVKHLGGRVIGRTF
jgi:hypothetical protein